MRAILWCWILGLDAMADLVSIYDNIWFRLNKQYCLVYNLDWGRVKVHPTFCTSSSNSVLVVIQVPTGHRVGRSEERISVISDRYRLTLINIVASLIVVCYTLQSVHWDSGDPTYISPLSYSYLLKAGRVWVASDLSRGLSAAWLIPPPALISHWLRDTSGALTLRGANNTLQSQHCCQYYKVNPGERI